MIRISQATFKNIGAFDNVEITFPQSQTNTEVHILTGPNGSGKTTILLGLIGAFKRFNKEHRSKNTERVTANFLHKRFQYFEYDESSPISDKQVIYKSDINVFFENNLASFIKIWGCPNCGALHTRTYSSIDKIDAYEDGLEKLSPEIVYDKDFVCFAYSGYRYIKNRNTTRDFGGIDLTTLHHPLKEALELVKPALENDLFLYWINKSISKSAIEKSRGNDELAQKYVNAIRILEQLISEIVGYQIQFDVKTETDQVVLKTTTQNLDFDVLPDGLRSLISWIGDLLMRLDRLNWKDETPLLERRILLFLDEIEVHLHPAWQRKVLPIVTKIFKNAQIFITTHSPFVINSIDGATIYKLGFDENNPEKAVLKGQVQSNSAESHSYVLEEIMGVKEDYGWETEKALDLFYQQRDALLRGETIDQVAFTQLALELAQKSFEIQAIIQMELKQLSKITKTNLML